MDDQAKGPGPGPARRIGAFQIEGYLGRGGMGEVYRARQVDLDRTVAVKLLGPALDRPADVARFRREARAVARLRHPGIVAIHSFEQTDGVCFMVQEFIDGVSLRVLIDRLAATRDPSLGIDGLLTTPAPDGPETLPLEFSIPATTSSGELDDEPAIAFDPTDEPTTEARTLMATPGFLRRATAIVRDAARALAHAHERGVVHRDIKPGNILIDREGQVRLIDFGIARFFDDARLTRTAQLMGTPIYMSPEQAAARLEVDHRTDVYSLGLVLYELLTLRWPIRPSNTPAVLLQIVAKEMAPVSSRNPAVPGDLEAIVHQAIAKDPDRRYPTAAAFADDLQRWLDGRPVLADPYRPPGPDVAALRAERPAAASIAATFFFVYAFFGTLIVLAVGVIAQRTGRDLPTYAAFAALVALDVAAHIRLGLGLLAGRDRDRRLGLGLSGLMMAFYAVYFAACVQALADGGRDGGFARPIRVLIESFNSNYPDRTIGHAFQALVTALLFASKLLVAALLLRRETRSWFAKAERLQAAERS